MSATTAITLTLAFITSPTPLNAPGPNDPTYNDTSGMDLMFNLVGGQIIGRVIIVPFFRLVGYTVQRLRNFVTPRITAPPVPGAPASGTLGTGVASTFEGGIYTRTVTKVKMIVYRAEGGGAGNFGKWYGTEKPVSAVDADIMSNLSTYGKNTMEKVVTYEVPAGTTIYQGRVAGGAGQQIYIENPVGAGLRVISSEPLPVGFAAPSSQPGSLLH